VSDRDTVRVGWNPLIGQEICQVEEIGREIGQEIGREVGQVEAEGGRSSLPLTSAKRPLSRGKMGALSSQGHPPNLVALKKQTGRALSGN
jgi:hypothetical protein